MAAGMAAAKSGMGVGIAVNADDGGGFGCVRKPPKKFRRPGWDGGGTCAEGGAGADCLEAAAVEAAVGGETVCVSIGTESAWRSLFRDAMP